MDGTVFRTQPDASKENIPGFSELLGELKKRSRKVQAVTNDCGAKTVSSVADVFERIGINISKQHIFTPLRLAGNYFKKEYVKGSIIVVLG